MTTSHARDVLAQPVRTDADVLARVGAVISEEARRQRTLWLFFLNADGFQSDVVVPIDGIPESPEPEDAGSVCYIISEALAGTADGSAIITLGRPGPAEPGDGDLAWLRALQRGGADYQAPIRMLCLATPSGVRELGPVSAGA